MKITYITYQGIPSYNTFAYGICTFSSIKYFVKNNFKVKLVFPLREKNATTDISKLQEFYEMYEDFEIEATKHYLPFGRIRILEKYMFIFSHICWSYYVTRKHSKEKNITVFTLSDWVFYFLSKKNINVVYECHDLTNLRKKLVLKSIKHKNSKIICINKYIKEDLKIEEGSNVIVLENGYDDDIFFEDSNKEDKIKLVFSGNLQRFGKGRGVKEIINYFLESQHINSAEMHIFGGPKSFASQLEKEFVHENIFIHGHKKRGELSRVLSKSHVGILTNVDSTHAQRHTSPVKYYEYLGSGMNVIATDSLAHRELPFQSSIDYFDLDNKESFLNALNAALKKLNENKQKDFSTLTLHHRMKKIINFITDSPEGLEPS